MAPLPSLVARGPLRAPFNLRVHGIRIPTPPNHQKGDIMEAVPTPRTWEMTEAKEEG